MTKTSKIALGEVRELAAAEMDLVAGGDVPVLVQGTFEGPYMRPRLTVLEAAMRRSVRVTGIQVFIVR